MADEKESIKLAYSGAVAEKRGTGDITASDLNREFGADIFDKPIDENREYYFLGLE